MERRSNERLSPDHSMSVYDRRYKLLVGSLVNLSADGAMLVVERPLKSAAVLKCEVPLDQEINGCRSVIFDAECRWCRKNVATGEWEAGFRLTADKENSYILSVLMMGFKLCGWGDVSVPDAKTTEQANRRKSLRFEFDETLPVYEALSYRQIGTIGDISYEGFRIISDKPIREGQTITCRIKLPVVIFRMDYLTVTAQCVRSRQVGTGKYESGYLFTSMSKQDGAALLNLIIHHGHQQQSRKKILVVG
jgi:hypothetical protein